MKKTLTSLLLGLLLSGCASNPQDIPMSGESTTKTDVKLDTNVLGVTFESLFSVKIGDTYNVSNKSGAVGVNAPLPKNNKGSR